MPETSLINPLSSEKKLINKSQLRSDAERSDDKLIFTILGSTRMARVRKGSLRHWCKHSLGESVDITGRGSINQSWDRSNDDSRRPSLKQPPESILDLLTRNEGGGVTVHMTLPL
jgi:hypothetical protein